RRHALLALRLVLELRLTLELPQGRDGVQDPVELRVLGDVRLHEDDGPRRIDAGGEEPDRHVDRALGQGRCVVGLRDGMEVHDAEQAVVLVLQLDPVLHGAEGIADVQLAGRLDAGKDERHGLTPYDGGVGRLDGTTNCLHGYPQYAVSSGALVGGVLSVGVVHDVPRDRAYWGASELGAWEGERPLQVSRLAEPRQALVGTGFPFKSLPLLRRYLDQFAAVMEATSGIRRAGAAALDLTDVAAGRLDCFWELT